MIQRSEGRGPERRNGGSRGTERGGAHDPGRQLEGPKKPKSRVGEMAWIAVLTAAGALLAALVLVRMLKGIGGPEVRIIEAQGAPVDPVLLAADMARVDEIVRWLAAPERAGRDTPSLGLAAAQDYVAAVFQSLGLEPAGDANTLWDEAGPGGNARRQGPLAPYLRPFTAKTVEFGRVPLERPVPGECLLEAPGAAPFVLGQDFVPLAGSHGTEAPFRGIAEGKLIFAGYGIDNEPSGYDDFAGIDVKGKVAIVLGGEPLLGGSSGRSADSLFGGGAPSAEASLWNKIDALVRHGAVGALMIRTEGEVHSGGELPFHSTRASWVPPTFDEVRAGLPALEISRAAAERLLGVPPSTLGAEIGAAGSSLPAARRAELAAAGALGKTARIGAATERQPGVLYNVVGLLRGTSPSAACIIVGAHLDHIGVGPRGRIGYGADDNASGVAALLRAAELLSESRPPFSVLFCAFTGEEDGLMGSKSLAVRLPPDTGPVIAMVNLDMIGRGETQALAALRGAPDGKQLARLDRAIEAATSAPTASTPAPWAHGIERVQVVHDPSFFTRSDHYSFYEVGIPSVFLFEGWPHQIGVYHTWKDTPDTLNMEKIARTTRLLLSLCHALATAGQSPR